MSLYAKPPEGSATFPAPLPTGHYDAALGS